MRRVCRRIMENVEIREFGPQDMALAGEIGALVGQLTSSPGAFAPERLAAMVSEGASRMFLLLAAGRVAGMLSMGVYTTPTGRKVWIEDVVVDVRYRGRGFGRMLVGHAVREARQLAPVTLMLTSRPSRVEANALYLSAGFEPKRTNVYKMEITDK